MYKKLAFVAKSRALLCPTQAGTPYYMAPELLLGSHFYDGKVDVFALAICWLKYLFPEYYGPPFVKEDRKNKVKLVSSNAKYSRKLN